MTISLEFTFDPKKVSEYKEDFRNVLTKAYWPVTGFESVKILSVSAGSILCDHVININTERFGDSAGIPRIAEEVKEELLNKTIPYLERHEEVFNGTSLANATFNRAKYEDHLDEATNKAVLDPCSVLDAGCVPGYGCQVSGIKVHCQSDCETGTVDCGHHGKCTLDNGNTTCVCFEYEDEIYSGPDCKTRVQKFQMAKDEIIAIGTGVGGGILLVMGVIIIFLFYKLRRKKNTTSSDDQDTRWADPEIMRPPASGCDVELVGYRDRSSTRSNSGTDEIHSMRSHGNQAYSTDSTPRFHRRGFLPWQSIHRGLNDYEYVDEDNFRSNLSSLYPISDLMIDRPKLTTALKQNGDV